MNPTEILKNPEEFKKLSKKIFDSYDINKDGVVDRNELKRALAKFYTAKGGQGPDDSVINETFKALDFDKNNSLTPDEFEVYMKKVLTQCIM